MNRVSSLPNAPTDLCRDGHLIDLFPQLLPQDSNLSFLPGVLFIDSACVAMSAGDAARSVYRRLFVAALTYI